MIGSGIGKNKMTIGKLISTIISYIILVTWTLLTIVPLFWMFYSSFKSNEELTVNIYSFPHGLFDNANDEYIVIDPSRNLNVRYPYNHEKDKRERLVIESTTIAPRRGFMVFHFLKEKLPPELANLKEGDLVKVKQFPFLMQVRINWFSIWFNYTSAFTRTGGGLGFKFINSVIYSTVATFLLFFLV